MKEKRTNKTKAELVDEVRKNVAVKHQVELAKKIYPLIEDQKTIYDAQTALGAAAGFIKLAIHNKTKEIFVNDIMPDIQESLKNEKKSDIKTAVENIINLLGIESAEEMVLLLDGFGKTLSGYSAKEYMQKPMSDIKLSDIIK